jgi:hypothetical protein
MAAAVLFALAFVGVQIILRWRRGRALPSTVTVMSFRDVPKLLRERRCPCGRLPDEDGELSDGMSLSVSRSCVCGRTERVRFVLMQ